MLEFESHSLEELEEEARQKATQVSIEILNGICKALDEGADVVTFAFLSNIDMDVNINKENFLEGLKINFPRVEAAEEFELCARATKWIAKLEETKEV